jgi:hypothetical protein
MRSGVGRRNRFHFRAIAGIIMAISGVFVTESGVVQASILEQVGQWGTGSYNAIKVVGHYAYCATSNNGLDIIDVSDATQPRRIGSFDQPGSEATCLAVYGSTVYLGGYESTSVINVSRPESPKLVNNLMVAARGMDIRGSTLAIAGRAFSPCDPPCNRDRLYIYDVSDPGAPRLTGSLNAFQQGEEIRDVDIRGQYAFMVEYWVVAGGDKGWDFVIVSLNDPYHPTVVGQFNSTQHSYPFDIEVKGSFAYVTFGGGFVVFDISNVNSPVIIPGNGMSRDASDQKDCQRRETRLRDHYAFCTASECGLAIYDVTNPKHRVYIGSCDTPDYAKGIALKGNYAYVADTEAGLQIINIEDLTAPTVVGSYSESCSQSTSRVHGEILYLAGSNGLRILDMGDPEKPTLVNTIPSDYLGDLAEDENLLGGFDLFYLHFFDVINPLVPVPLGSFPIEAYSSFDCCLRLPYAYVIADYQFMILDVSDPNNPTLSGCIVSDYENIEMVISGDFAYLASGSDGLVVVDISDPSGPHIVSSCNLWCSAKSLALAGNTVFIITEGYGKPGGLYCVDISDPLIPSIIGSYFNKKNYCQVSVSGTLVFVTSYDGMLDVIDVTTPSSPQLIEGFQAVGNGSHSLNVENATVYLAAGKLYIFSISR